MSELTTMYRTGVPPDLCQGAIREWHFHFETGEVYAPTLTTDYSSVRWMVRCVLARRMRFDTLIEQEVWDGV